MYLSLYVCILHVDFSMTVFYWMAVLTKALFCPGSYCGAVKQGDSALNHQSQTGQTCVNMS